MTLRSSCCGAAIALALAGCKAPADAPTSQTPSAQPAPPTSAANALPTPEAGRFLVGPLYDGVVEVALLGADGDERALAASEWSYDPASGLLDVDVPVAEGQTVVAHGRRSVPWGWRSLRPWRPDSVRVLIGETPGVRGVDFEVERDGHLIRMLRAEACTPEQKYFVTGTLAPEAGEPSGSAVAVSFGNQDSQAIRRFLGLPETTSEAPVEATIGTNATATDDPAVFRISGTMRTSGLRVGIAARDDSEEVRWLGPGDYAYDPDGGAIRLREGLTVDPATEFVLVSGVPVRQNVFRLPADVAPGDVKVVVDGKRLEEGVGYRVDASGELTILVPGFGRGSRYFIVAGSFALGNVSGESVRDLLE